MMDSQERSFKRAAVRKRLTIKPGTRLKAGDLEFLFQFVTQYDERFRGRKIVLEHPVRRGNGQINENCTEYKCLTFGEYAVNMREEHKLLEGGKVELVYVDREYSTAGDILLCFKEYVNNGWFREDEDLTDLLVFGPEYRW